MELRAFMSRCVKENKPVIPVLLPGVSEFPEPLGFLAQLNHVSFAESVDEKEILDLIQWGITGSKPPDLMR
jgi:hypothetical protein